jgi:long-chain acyl-CoA synthetase
LAVRAQHAVFSRLVYGKLREALGGRCQYAVSGGAPLGDRLGHFYRGIGVTVLEGYGLTETTAASRSTSPAH